MATGIEVEQVTTHGHQIAQRIAQGLGRRLCGVAISNTQLVEHREQLVVPAPILVTQRRQLATWALQ